MTQRRRHGGAFKTRVVVESIAGHKTANEIARACGSQPLHGASCCHRRSDQTHAAHSPAWLQLTAADDYRDCIRLSICPTTAGTPANDSIT